jgi:hypothetical protein
MEAMEVTEIKEEDVVEEWNISTLRAMEDVLDVINGLILQEAARKAVQ